MTEGIDQRAASLFQDPVAEMTSWEPAKAGSTSNIANRKLVQQGPDRWEFRTVLGLKIFCAVALILGLAILATYVSDRVSAGVFVANANAIVIPLVGLALSIAGGVSLYRVTAPVVIDKRHGWIWKGRRRPAASATDGAQDGAARLDDIHALQLIAEYIRGDSGGSYRSVELNLVRMDGSRINLIDHGDAAQVLADAQTIATALDKPIWDGRQLSDS